MKVLILIIFNNSEIYNEMLSIQRTYLHNNPNIDVYFVTFNETLLEDVTINNDFIYIKGSESYTNILYKTIQSLDYIKNVSTTKYDFLVRSNISTIIHLDNLFKYLSTLPKTNIYTGGTIETLLWTLQTYEIIEQNERNNYYGLKYIQGTGIIMSFDVVEEILKIKNDIQYNIVDDVKLGLIIRTYFPNIYKNIENITPAKVSYNQFEEDCIFIRNKSYNPKLDVYQIRNLVEINNFNVSFLKNNNTHFDKTIYITNKNINNKLLKVKQEWQDLNEEYNIVLYDDEMCINFLNKYFCKKYSDIFNFIPDGPIKCDFFRCCIIYIFGGIYVDSDIKPLVPLKEYVCDDIDFLTCVSYNYSNSHSNYSFNPQIIVAKKYSSILYKIIRLYENMYDNKQSYTYWTWSICYIFKKMYEFNMTVDGNNIFIHNNKKYQFIVEQILDQTTNIKYNFTNLNKNKLTEKLIMFCEYKNKTILNNFANK
jgi:mannosyltransferase OCH1-like enzyme